MLPEHKSLVYDKNCLTFVTSSIRRSPPDCLDSKIRHKDLAQSVLVRIEINRIGADATLMLDHDGLIAEDHDAHVFIVAVTGVTSTIRARARRASRSSRCSISTLRATSTTRYATCRGWCSLRRR